MQECGANRVLSWVSKTETPECGVHRPPFMSALDFNEGLKKVPSDCQNVSTLSKGPFDKLIDTG